MTDVRAVTANTFLCALVLAPAWLAGCGGSGDDGPPPGTPAHLTIVSGNGQTAEQHVRIPQDLVVAITDRDGVPVDASVEFAPAPGSPTFATTWPLAKIQNPRSLADGVHWFAYFHATGPHRVVAKVAGLPPVTFDVDVLPSTHPYDGPYMCPGFGAMTIVHGVLQDQSLVEDPFHFIFSAVVDETTGAMSAHYRQNLDYRVLLTGQMAADASGQVTGAGTWDLLYHDLPPSLDTGSWTCSRF